MKTLKLIAKFLACYIAFAATVWGTYTLLALLPPYDYTDIVYPIILYAIIHTVPALIAFGYSLLVYSVLRNSPKRSLKALLNGVAMAAFSIGIIFMFKYELGQYIVQVPAMCVLSIMMPLVMLALRPKSLPQAELVPEAVEESK